MSNTMDAHVIAKVQSFGFQVYMRDLDKDSWLYFTDGTHIGYLEVSRLGGYHLATVHIPNKSSGTGYSIERDSDELTKEDLLRCFIHAPHWARSADRDPVVKWRNMEQFLNADSFNKGYRLIPSPLP